MLTTFAVPPFPHLWSRNEEVYGDFEPSDPQCREKLEGNGSDEYQDSAPSEDSDASIDRFQSRRKGTSSINPLTGELQKRGRPRKSIGGGVAGRQPNRIFGRASKDPVPAVAENISGRAHGDAGNKAPLENGIRPGEQSHDRPNKMAKLQGTSEKHGEVTYEGGRPVTLKKIMTVPPAALVDDSTNGEADSGAGDCKPYLPTHASEAEEGASSVTENRASSRPASSTSRERAAAKPEMNGSSPLPIQKGAFEKGIRCTTEKRKRGRPRKHAVAPCNDRGGVGIGSAFSGVGEGTMRSSQQVSSPDKDTSNTTGKRKRGRPRKDGAAPGSARVGASIGRTHASKSDVKGGAGCIVPQKKVGRPRKDRKDITTQSTSLGEVGADGAGVSSEKKWTSVQPGSAESTMNTIQSNAKVDAGSMVPKRKVGRPRKDVTTPGTLRGGVGADSMPSVPKSEELATFPNSQDVGRRGIDESATKRGRGRPRKVGTMPISAHGAVGASSRSAYAISQTGLNGALSNTQPKVVQPKSSSASDEEMRKALRQFIAEDASGIPRDKLVSSSQGLNFSENSSRNTSEKRKRGRPRKHVASSNDQSSGVTQGDCSNKEKVEPEGSSRTCGTNTGADNNEGKKKLGKPREKKASPDILSRNAPEDGSSSNFAKRKVCRTSKHETSPGTQRNDAAGDGMGSNAGKRKAGPSQETEAASGPQEGLGANVATIGAGTLNVGLSQEPEALSTLPPRHDHDGNSSTIDDGNRKAHSLQEMEASSASPRQDVLDRNGPTIDAGTLKVGLSQETEASSNSSPQEGLDGSVAAINAGKRKVGPWQETEASPAASPQEGFDRNGATIDDGKRKAGKPRAMETVSAPTPQDGVDGSGEMVDIGKRKGINFGKRKAGLPRETEALAPPLPREDLDRSGATMKSGKRKAGGVRKHLRILDKMEEGGASSGVVESQLGPTGDVATSADASQSHAAGHIPDMNAGGKSMSGLKRREASVSDGSSSAQQMPTKRRGRGRPRKIDRTITSKPSATESRASILKKHRDDCGDPSMALPAASVSDNPRLSPSSWALIDGHTEPTRASHSTSSDIKVESTCPTEDELSCSADPAESSCSITTPDDSNSSREVSYVFTPTGRKAVLKNGREN